MPTNKILGIELLKFLAAIFITNSHFKALYVDPFTPLGTLGAPGNALFFFISGYTLMLGRKGPFAIWYKRRISRIWPSVISWSSFIGPVIFGLAIGWKDIWLAGNYWFIHCIVIYYAIFYFLMNYIDKYFKWLFGGCILASLVHFLLMPITPLSIYQVSLHYVCFFSVMLMGAYLSIHKDKIIVEKQNYSSLVMAFLMIGTFYGFQAIGKGKSGFLYYVSIVSLAPLHGFIYYLYKSIMGVWVLKLLQTRIVGNVIRFVAALTLEIYLVGFVLCLTCFNNIFPLNIPLVFFIIVVMAYVVKIIANFILQTFETTPYDWKKMVVII